MLKKELMVWNSYLKSLIDDYDDTITFNLLSYINSFDNASLRKASNHFVQKLEQGNWCARLHFDK